MPLVVANKMKVTSGLFSTKFGKIGESQSKLMSGIGNKTEIGSAEPAKDRLRGLNRIKVFPVVLSMPLKRLCRSNVFADGRIGEKSVTASVINNENPRWWCFTA